MREIKFRAWDKNNNEMVEVVSIDYGAYKTKIEYLTVKYKNNETLTEYADNFELIQYTGLKDKNGKEIYAGDICKAVTKNNNSVIGVVEYRSGYYVIDGKDEYAVLREWLENFIYIEKLGNKYENPELLEADTHD